MPKGYWVTVYRSISDPQKLAAYESPAYQNALKALGNGAVRDIRVVEGLD